MLEKIDLKGKWQFELDQQMKGIDECYFLRNLKDEMVLPTTTSEAKKGEYNLEENVGYLTDPYLFEGYAWYAKEIIIPKQYLNKTIKLTLERTRISHVWIDDQYVGNCNSLCSKHIYELSKYIIRTHHKITIMTDNTAYPTKGGHMTSPDTQTNWNGITGEISLIIYDDVYLSNIKLYTDIHTKSVRIKGDLKIKDTLKDNNEMVLCAYVIDEKETFEKQKMKIKDERLDWSYYLGEKTVLWSEYTPKVYSLVIEIEKQGECIDRSEYRFGLREFKAEKNRFTINGNDTFLRGKHDGLIFPLTGYAPTDVESWLQVMQTAKLYGINHYRFHTCCPPKAAFTAADQLGIYMEPELPFWGTITSPLDEQHDEEMHQYLVNEGYRILDEFGDHPSFVMMSLGNELWGNKEVLNDILGAYKNYDNRHLYTQGCNNFQFSPCILENDDFFCGVRFSEDRLFRGSYAMCDAPQGHIQVQPPNTTHCYDDKIRPTMGVFHSKNKEGSIEIQYGTGIKTVDLIESEELIPNVPVIAHEIGQYEVFPNFKEIQKYKGVLEPRNLQVFEKRLSKSGMLHRADAYFKASGKLAAACYKNEIETAFRSHELAGFQILDLQDFTGQGTALVGMLDAFMESKGLITPEKWKSFCSDAVLMAKFPSYVCELNEVFKSTIEIAYFRPEIVHDARLKIKLLSQEEEIYTEIVTIGEIAIGHTVLYELAIQFPNTLEPRAITLTIEIDNTDIQNSYTLWVYPSLMEEINNEDEIVTTSLEKACEALQVGKRVLYLPEIKNNTHSIEGTYCTNFWNYPMFRSISESVGKPVPIGTMGLLIDYKHPALKYFPSEFYTTPQWFDIVSRSNSTILDGIISAPIVQTIDNFERNHMLGLIFEVKIGEGKLLVCTAELDYLQDSISAKWLYYSLKKYVSTEKFEPKEKMALEVFKRLYQK